MIAPARKKAMNDHGWGPHPDFDNKYASAPSDADMDWFRDLLDRAQWSTVSGINCDQHQKDMKKLLNGAPMYWAKDELGGRDGQTINANDGNVDDWIFVFDWKKRSDDAMLDLLLHEGWHWVHKETEEGTDAEDAERCASISLEEEDDEPSEGGGDPEEPECEEKLVEETYIDFELQERPEQACSVGDDGIMAVYCVNVVVKVWVPVEKTRWVMKNVCES
ncbi:MAG: hypothetical protein OXI76_10195 [Gemmatimonadota bacterium]|nr:hypothetical protein [Gemmatimonadota bacterium]